MRVRETRLESHDGARDSRARKVSPGCLVTLYESFAKETQKGFLSPNLLQNLGLHSQVTVLVKYRA